MEHINSGSECSVQIENQGGGILLYSELTEDYTHSSISILKMMKAAVYQAFNESIEVRSVPKPRLANESNVIIQVMATGVCRSDWHDWKGHGSDIKDHGLLCIPGHEFAGIVVQIGARVKEVQVGDRVAVPFILSCGRCCGCSLGRHTVSMKQQQPGFTMMGSFGE
mmetsp:Transcript_17326/g.25236  ORF Transcript_17326/g.25236 Transcript_17326/m.25236 type:complete len:166 (+) Transcript_17326:303-800(+)